MKILNCKKTLVQKNCIWWEIEYDKGAIVNDVNEFSMTMWDKDIINIQGVCLKERRTKEDELIIKHIESIKITAAERVKMSGLKSLNQMAEITKQSTQTLNNWYNTKNRLFEVLLEGCITVLNEKRIY